MNIFQINKIYFSVLKEVHPAVGKIFLCKKSGSSFMKLFESKNVLKLRNDYTLMIILQHCDIF